MIRNFSDRLIESIKQKKNPTVAGLDPKLEYIPAHLINEFVKRHGNTPEAAGRVILEFNKQIIDAIHDIVPAVKPQLAYYEMYGIEGIKAFYETVEYAQEKGLLVIADGKRNDIGSTAEAYAEAYLGKTLDQLKSSAFNADALTVNPYLGEDGIKPFIKKCAENGKGIFVLVKTSNKSSGQLQDLITESGKRIYEVVAGLVDDWGQESVGEHGYSSIGAVVGATYPEQAAELRKQMSKAIILVPGYGAQGGTAEDVAKSFNKDGLGALVNASRSLMCAYKSERWKKEYAEVDFAQATRAEAVRMRDDIIAAL